MVKLNPDEFRSMLHLQVKDELRKKRLQPRGFPFNILAVDGKKIGRGGENFHEDARSFDANNGECIEYILSC